MSTAPLTRTFLGPALFAALAGTLILTRLVPLAPGAAGWPGPDLLLCLTMAWMLRRPDLLPVGLVAAVALLADLLLQRPPGLWAGLVVLGSEYMRGRAQPGQEPSPTGELVLFGGLFAGMVCANWLVLGLFMVPQPPLLGVLAQVPVTVLFYIVIALMLVHLFGIRRASDSGGPGRMRR